MTKVAGLVAVVVLSMPSPGAAQVTRPLDPDSARGGIEGRVTTEEGTGLADVAITFVGQEHAGTSTDVVGRFALTGVEAGLHELSFERLGYGQRTVVVDVQPRATVRVEATMTPEAIELDAIAVTVDGGLPFLEANGFYQRSRRGFGLQLSRTQLDEIQALEVSDAVRQIPGILLQYDTRLANVVIATSPRTRRLDGQTCSLTVYVDGVRTLDPNLNQVSPDWLIGMEVYLGAETPAQFRTLDACGVVLLWTRQR